LQRRKNALESSSLPAKLSDCRSEDVSRTELFVVEGESALGTTKAARNSEFQAILPLRGKILNVQKASLSQMLDNAECAAIIQVIGAGSGKSFSLDDVRYGRIILMSDADVDGAHIRCLLLTLIYRYMQPLIEDGRVFAAIPPLHRIEVLGSGGKKGEAHYTYSDDEMKKLLGDLKKQGKKWREPIQRYKGLGEMDADQLRETTMDPAHRTLRRITIKDGAEAEKLFELLMGNEVAPRKDFISSADVDRERIDA
jgi:DNA gyrase subunit B